MKPKLLALVMLPLVVGAGLGYSISLPQIMTLQSSVSELESETAALTNDCNNLNETYIQLTTELSILLADYNYLNESHVELLQQYEALQFRYNLINGPASNSTTFEDLQITLTIHRTTYYHKDPVSGNVTITYLNGTAFNGKFGIRIKPEFGGYDADETDAIYDVNGYGEFVLQRLYSFRYGVGIYTIYLGRIHTVDDYVVAVGDELEGTAVQVEAK